VTRSQPNIEPVCRTGKITFADPAAKAHLGEHVDTLRDPAAAGFEQVKHNTSRTVYRGDLGGQAVYIKHYHNRSLSRRVARWLGRYDAMHEMTFSQYLSAHGVPTPRALAAECSSDHHWLVTAAVAPAESVSTWHEARLTEGEAGRRRVHQATVALAEMIGRMHAAGVLHGDLHCGNVLIRTDSDDLRLVLTDLHRAHRRRRPTRTARAANLALLLHDRFDFTTRSDRLRFLTHYLRAGGAEGSLRGWQIMIEHFAARHRRRQNAQRDRRIFRTNRYFARLRLADRWRGHVVLESKRQLDGSNAAGRTFTADQWREVLSDPRALLDPDGATIHKDSASSLVLQRRIRLGDVELDVFVKCHRHKTLVKRLVDCFRPSRALRAFGKGHALLTRRIWTALPLAAMERRVGPMLTHNILITEAIDHWPRLDHFLTRWLGPSPTGHSHLSVKQQHQLARDVLRKMGRILQQLHDSTFAHRDLKATNMFVRWRVGEPPEIILVDLDGLRRVWRITTRQRFQGLMRLNVSLLICPAVNTRGQLRMLTGYLRRPGSGRINFKPYWRLLEIWSARKINQQIRSRRNAQHARRQAATKGATA
jgi:tRNA A-37 threonylcarbamoyl transferase component Bud32